MSHARAVPVLMMHSIAPPGALAPFAWLESLATPPDLLEASLALWRRRGYRTLRLEELADYLRGGRQVPKRCLVLTLDDGYVDNWIALHPLLQTYGFCATVFVTTDFIDPRPIRRRRMDEAGPEGLLEWKGYLSWEEMRAMESAGTVQIQSHAQTHTWYFVSDRIVDYYRPGNALTRGSSMLRFLWLNAHTERKPFALSEMAEDSIPWGTPIYDYRPALVARRYFPDPSEALHLTEFVAARGGALMFEAPDWRSRLDGQVAAFRKGRGGTGGESESEEAQRTRVLGELVSSRRILSEGLGKEVDVLCYPQGAMNPSVEQLSREAGYSMWTLSSWGRRGVNRPGRDPSRIYRCGRGYNLFGGEARRDLQLLSQRVVLARFSGSAWAHLATGVLSRGGALLRRLAGASAAAARR